MSAAAWLGFALFAALAAAGAVVAARRLPERARVALGFATAGGVVASWFGVLTLRDTAEFWLAPLPLSADAWILLGLALLVGLVALAIGFVPDSAARWLAVAVVVAVFVWLAAFYAIEDPVFRAWSPFGSLAWIAVGIALPRVVAASVAGHAYPFVGVVAGLVLGLVTLAAIFALSLMSVFPTPPPTKYSWDVTVTPNATGEYTLAVPFLASDQPTMQTLLARVKDDVKVDASDATLTMDPNGTGFLLRASRPVHIHASASLILGAAGTAERFDVNKVRLASGDWSYHGPGHADVTWAFGRGCGQEPSGVLTVGEPLQPPASGQPVMTVTTPYQSPCVHAD